MEQQEKNMELNEVSPHVGLEDSQRAQTSDQTSNEVKLESEFVEFTESNEDNENFQFVNCESVKITYLQLITEALENAPNGMLVSSYICFAISDAHPQFKLDEPNWQ